MAIRRVRTAWRRPATAGLALLVAATAFAVIAGGRADLAARTSSLRATIAATGPEDRVVEGTSDYRELADSTWVTAGLPHGEFDLTTTRLAEVTAAIRDQLGARVPLTAAAGSWFTLTGPAAHTVAAPPAAVPGGLQPRLVQIFVDTIAGHSRLVAGSWPETSGAPAAGDTTAKPPVDVALPTASAALLGVHVGSLILVRPDPRPGEAPVDPSELRVVGVYEPHDPSGDFWSANAPLAAPMFQKPLGAEPSWELGVVIGPERAGTVVGDRSSVAPPALRWGFPIDTSKTDADRLADLTDRLDNVPAVGDRLRNEYGLPVDLSTRLPTTLHWFLDAQDLATRAQAMPVAGLALIAGAAAIMLGVADVRSRRGEQIVQRGRGAGVPRLALDVLTDSLITVIPVAAVAVAAAKAVPGSNPRGLFTAIVVPAVVVLTLPALLTVLSHRRSPGSRPRRSATGRLALSRRATLHGTTALICVAGLELVREHGLAPNGGIDLYSAAAPVLTGGLAALATITALPPALRFARRRAAAGDGITALLGTARVAQTPATVQATVFVLTTAVCTADLALALARSARRAVHDPVAATSATSLAVLAVAAVVAATAFAGLAVRLDTVERRPSAFRLKAMGLSAGQARGVAVAEAAPAALLSALTGAAAAVPLMWLVGPALQPDAPRVGIPGLLWPAAAVAVPAVLAALAGAVGVDRGAARALRIGDEL